VAVEGEVDDLDALIGEEDGSEEEGGTEEVLGVGDGRVGPGLEGG